MTYDYFIESGSRTFFYLFLDAGVPLRGELVLGHAVQVLNARRTFVTNDRENLSLGFAVAYWVAQDGATQIVAFLCPIARLWWDEKPAI